MRRKENVWRAIPAALLVTLLSGACYWTADEEQGGLTLEIDAGKLGASQLEEYGGFFFGWVVADDLMRGDQAAADQAFDEVNSALDEALFELETTGNLSDFSIDLAFPSIQLQANFVTGTSGSNTFAGLTAGREYLVVVEAYDFADNSDGVGFTTANVTAGETRNVTIDVSNDWAAFYKFLQERYALSEGPETSVPATIQVIDAEGWYFGEFSPVYVELVDGNSDSPTSFASFDDWYATVDVLNTLGEVIAKTGDRALIPDGQTYYTFEETAIDRSWRVVITTWPGRSDPSNDMLAWVSDSFTTYSGDIALVELPYEFVELPVPIPQ